MTVTEETTTAEANGAQPEAPAPVLDEGDGIDYLPDGRTRLTIDGVVYTLRVPLLGMFRELFQRWQNISRMQRAQLVAAQQALTSATTEETPIGDVIDEVVKFDLFLFNGDPENPKWRGLSDKALSEDSDNWPAWLGTATWQAPLLTHMRDRPLARGGTASQG